MNKNLTYTGGAMVLFAIAYHCNSVITKLEKQHRLLVIENIKLKFELHDLKIKHGYKTTYEYEF